MESESHLRRTLDPKILGSYSPLDQLLYASNLLGKDAAITNFGGGNTSFKAVQVDTVTGLEVEVLYIKASGGDLGTSTAANFATLDLKRITGLEAQWRKGVHEDDLVPLYSLCSFCGSTAAPSIDTPLHALVPYAAVSHMHPDSIIALAASENSEKLTEQIFGGRVGYLPWKRPGFELGIQLRELILMHPKIVGAILGGHGLICWSDDWESCFNLTLDLIDQARDYITTHGKPNPFGKKIELNHAAPHWSTFLPELRGKVCFEGNRLIAHIDESPDVLEFLESEKAEKLSKLGTSCPDHFLRTKIRPLWLDDVQDLDSKLARFRKDYVSYYDRCKDIASPTMRNPNPSIILVPGLGMVSFGKTASEARISGEFFINAIHVMRGAESLTKYVALPEQEAFNIEYWSLEEAKLRRQPPEKELSRHIAIVTGGAQGIGKATSIRLVEAGSCIALLDINQERLGEAVSQVQVHAKSKDAVVGIKCDVTNLASLSGAFEEVICAFGGVDIVVVNAGNARRGTVVDTSEADYAMLSNLLMKGYFDTMAQAVKLMVRQKTGGSIVVVGSKNGVAVGSNAALYSAAKAFELHLMRTVALDFAKEGIRCNAVNPDGVVQGSGIWTEAWRTQTAASLGIEPEKLEDYYKERSLLKVSVTPSDIAEAILWLASEKKSSRTTGAVIPVDGGNREGLLR